MEESSSLRSRALLPSVLLVSLKGQGPAGLSGAPQRSPSVRDGAQVQEVRGAENHRCPRAPESAFARDRGPNASEGCAQWGLSPRTGTEPQPRHLQSTNQQGSILITHGVLFYVRKKLNKFADTEELTQSSQASPVLERG